MLIARVVKLRVAHRLQVGGEMHYMLNGAPVVESLFPQVIYVAPEPLLELRYFLERDIYSDDPFTAAIEPPVPATLGLLISNVGNGTARSLRISSGQVHPTRGQRAVTVERPFLLLIAFIPWS